MFEIAGVTWQWSFQEICPDFSQVSDLKTRFSVFTERIVPPVRQFTGSLLGKVIICTLADLKGSSYGSWAGRKLVRYGGGELGQSLAEYSLLIPLFASVTGSLYMMTKKTSFYTMAFFNCAMVFSIITLVYADRTQLKAFGATAGFECGDVIGNIAGIILGGGLALKLAGNPVKLWNKGNFSKTYTFCTLKYIATGAAFDFFLSSPAYPMPVALGACRLVSQVVAYNSHLFFPFVRTCVSERHLSKANLFASFSMQMVVNKISGFHRSSEEMLKMMETQISTPLSILSGIIKQALKLKIWKNEQDMIDDTVELCVNFAWRSLHDYVTVLEKSAPLKQAHSDFRKCFHSRPGKTLSKNELADREKFRGQLTGVFDQLFPQNSIYVGVLVGLLNRSDMKAQIADLVGKITELEIKAIGFTLLKKDEEYLKQCIDIYLKYYLIFILTNFNDLTQALSSEEEQCLILSLHRGVLLNYVKYAFPVRVVDKIGVVTTLGITKLYKMKEQWSRLTRKGLKEPFDDPKCVLVAMKDLSPQSPFDDGECEAVGEEPVVCFDDEFGVVLNKPLPKDQMMALRGRSPSSKNVCGTGPCPLVSKDSESENKTFVQEEQKPSENKFQLGPYDFVSESSVDESGTLVTVEAAGMFFNIETPKGKPQEWVFD